MHETHESFASVLNKWTDFVVSVGEVDLAEAWLKCNENNINDEEIEVSAFCTISALIFALPILNTATSID